ncbi:hypothetical protein FS749_005669 [Ceratobasidium sp. UAMH 11750]|nr:hypothetical protein FS749_005669 [Ceratobasidium sp. UAMH 11750]
MYKILARQRVLKCRAPVGVRSFSLSRIQKQEYQNVTPQVFEQVVLKGGSKPVIVDFYADWCQPCRMLSPTLEIYTKDPSNLDGKEVDLVTVNVDKQQELAAKYQVSALPTVIGFKNGEKVSSFVGLLNPSGVRKFIMDL